MKILISVSPWSWILQVQGHNIVTREQLNSTSRSHVIIPILIEESPFVSDNYTWTACIKLWLLTLHWEIPRSIRVVPGNGGQVKVSWHYHLSQMGKTKTAHSKRCTFRLVHCLELKSTSLETKVTSGKDTSALTALWLKHRVNFIYFIKPPVPLEGFLVPALA